MKAAPSEHRPSAFSTRWLIIERTGMGQNWGDPPGRAAVSGTGGVEAAEIARLNYRVGALVVISFGALNALLIVLAVRGG
jgi:hypothetical protein